MKLVAACLYDGDRKPEFVGLVRAYERETLVGELDLHTIQNMSPVRPVVNGYIVTMLQYENNA